MTAAPLRDRLLLSTISAPSLREAVAAESDLAPFLREAVAAESVLAPSFRIVVAAADLAPFPATGSPPPPRSFAPSLKGSTRAYSRVR